MKKLLLTAMLAALLALSLAGVAQAQTPEADLPQGAAAEEMEFIHGDVPAETDALDSMTPAIHGAVLAMLHHEQTEFLSSDPVTGWEALYNMLSLYGQMDDRADHTDEELFLPVETVMDFSTALAPGFDALGALPVDLSDRMVYDAASDGYRLICGSDSLAQVNVETSRASAKGLVLTGSLVYLVDGSGLAHFQAVLVPADNLFGYTIAALELL